MNSDIAQIIEGIENSTLSPGRKKYFIAEIKKHGAFTDSLRLELNRELQAEIAVLDEVLKEFPDQEKIRQAVQKTETEREDETLLRELDQKIKKLEQLRYEYEDKIAALDEFYDPLLEELKTPESRQKLQEEKDRKAKTLEEQLKQSLKKIGIDGEKFKNFH